MTTAVTPTEAADWNDSRQTAIVVSTALFLTVGNASFAAKLFAQRGHHPRIFLEDWCLLAALICSDIVAALYLTATHYGVGLHLDRVNAEDPRVPHRLVQIYFYRWLASVFNQPIMVGLKFAMLFLYRRLFLVNQKGWKIFWWANIVYLSLWFLASEFIFIFACTPVTYYWERLYAAYDTEPSQAGHGHCNIDGTAAGLIPFILAGVQDFALLLLPITVLAKLQMCWSRKLGLMVLFSLGIGASALDIARVIDLDLRSDSRGFLNLPDPTWDIVDFVIMSIAAEMVGIICVCLPVIAPWIAKGIRQLKPPGFYPKTAHKITQLFGRHSIEPRQNSKSFSSEKLALEKLRRDTSDVDVERQQFSDHGLMSDGEQQLGRTAV